MEKYERLKKAVDYLIDNGVAKSQADVARQMGANEKTLSFAINGKEKYVTDKLLERFCRQFRIISNEWLLKEEGEMLNKNGYTPVATGYNSMMPKKEDKPDTTASDEHDRLIRAETEKEMIRKIIETVKDESLALQIIKDILTPKEE